MPRSRWIFGCFMSLVAMLGTAAGQAVSAPTPQVSGALTINIGTVCTVGGIVLPATWWLSWRFTSIIDQLTSIAARLTKGDERLTDLEKRLTTLEARTKK